MSEGADLDLIAENEWGACPVPRSSLDMRGMPDNQALDLWREHTNILYDPQPREKYAGPVKIRVEAWRIGEMLLAEMDVPGQQWSRSRARIGRDGQDMFMLLLFRKGGNLRRNGDGMARVGDLLVQDMAQPQDTLGGDNETLMLFLPRRLLAPLLKAPDEHNLRILRATDPLAALLRDHLVAFHARLPGMSLDQAQAALPATLQLTAAALNGAVRDEQVDALRVTKTEHIRRHIDAHILDQDLGPETIALRFGMTRRNLGYLFEPEGGVAAYMRRRRLSLIRTALADPTRRGQSIEAIAQMHGFVHYRSFALAFQKQFALSPREARARALEGMRAPRPADGRAEWLHWLAEMG